MRETEGLRNDRSLRSQKVRRHDDCGISEDAVREEEGIKKRKERAGIGENCSPDNHFNCKKDEQLSGVLRSYLQGSD